MTSLPTGVVMNPGQRVAHLYLLHGHPPKGRWPWHYLGSSRDVDRRLYHHSKGWGSKAVRMMQKAGYRFDVARIWRDVPGGLVVEHTIKRHKDRLGLRAWKRLCPLCLGEISETLDFDAVIRLRGA